MERVLGALVLIFSSLTGVCFVYVAGIAFYDGISYVATLFGYAEGDVIDFHNWLCWQVFLMFVVFFGLTAVSFFSLFVLEALKGNDV